jgi:hypothetical protein
MSNWEFLLKLGICISLNLKTTNLYSVSKIITLIEHEILSQTKTLKFLQTFRFLNL